MWTPSTFYASTYQLDNAQCHTVKNSCEQLKESVKGLRVFPWLPTSAHKQCRAFMGPPRLRCLLYRTFITSATAVLLHSLRLNSCLNPGMKVINDAVTMNFSNVLNTFQTATLSKRLEACYARGQRLASKPAESCCQCRSCSCRKPFGGLHKTETGPESSSPCRSTSRLSAHDTVPECLKSDPNCLAWYASRTHNPQSQYNWTMPSMQIPRSPLCV